MKKYEPDTIRNAGIFSHGGEGKTSIVEAMLFLSGENTRLGRVDDGTSLMDYEPEEVERKITISSAIASFEWGKNKINFIDTPGDDNFVADAKSCMRVVDGAVVVVGAVSGVQVQTEKVWGYANEFSIPACIFINKMDRERADFERALADVQKNFSDMSVLAIQIPIGKEENFKGVVDLLAMKAYVFKADGSGGYDTVDIPAELADQAASYREKLVEAAVETDDEVMERYLNGDEIAEEEIDRCLREGMWARKIAPVILGSASKNIGVPMLLDTDREVFSAAHLQAGNSGNRPQVRGGDKEGRFRGPALQRLYIQDHYRSFCR